MSEGSLFFGPFPTPSQTIRISSQFCIQSRAKAFLRTAFLLTLAQVENRPVLLSYQADGTPVLVKEYRTVRIDSEHSTRRVGGHAGDFLLEKAFILYMSPSGQVKGSILMRDPRELDDKSAWSGYSAMANFFPLAREKGHRGLDQREFTPPPQFDFAFSQLNFPTSFSVLSGLRPDPSPHPRPTRIDLFRGNPDV